MSNCDVRTRLITTIKDEIKNKATSYTFEAERVFIPVSNVTKDKITSKDNAYKAGERIVNKINLKYKPWTNRDIVSLDSIPQEGVYVNIHPDSKVIDAYEYYEWQKDAEENLPKSGEQTKLVFSQIFGESVDNEDVFDKIMKLFDNTQDNVNIKKVLQNILADKKWANKNPEIYNTAKLFLNNIEKNKTINVQFLNELLPGNAEQQFTTETNSILLGINSFNVKYERFIESFLHEIGHSFTLNAVYRPNTTVEFAFQEEIERIYQKFLKSKKTDSYGWKNSAEFISEFWSSKDFRNELKTLDKPVWQQIIDSLVKLFGGSVKNNNDFDKLEKILTDYLSEIDKVSITGNFPIVVKQQSQPEYQWDNEGSAFEQQQRFFKRRIADLNKRLDKLPKYGESWRELKAQINELQLRVNEANTQHNENLYLQLGGEILVDVQGFLDELNAGTKIATDKFMDYTLDVLSIWKDFPGLETEVNRLRREIFPFIEDYNKEKVNQYATEGREITKQDIEDQNSDIRKVYNLGSRFLGSLSDSSNYLGRTIGVIIKEAQNRASTRSKKTRELIQVEIDNLYNWAIKSGVKPINMYDIFIQVDGNNSKLTQTHFANGEVNSNYEKIQNSPDLKRFYDFYQEQMVNSQLNFPLKPGKNFIPNIPATSIKRTLAEINPVKERILKENTITEEYLPDEIPMKYIKNISASEKSKDLGNSLLSFIRNTNSFEELSEILPSVRLLQEGIKYKLENGILTNRKYRKGSNPNLTVNGDNSDIFLMTEKVIEMQVLGRMKNEEGKIALHDMPDEDGNIKQTYFDLTGLIDNLLKWNSLLRVGLSPVTSTVNVILGDSQNAIEGFGGRFFNLSQLRQATQIFFKQTLEKGSVMNSLLEELNPLQNLDDYETLDKNLSSHILTKEKAQEYIYSLQKAGEKYLQSRTMLAMMLKEEYITSSGVLTDKWKTLSQQEKNKFSDKIQRTNIIIHGRYSMQEASVLQQGIIYRMVSQFRKWVAPAWEARTASRSYDVRLGMEFEGRYITYARLLREILKFKGQLEGGRKLSELEIYNLRKGISEIVLILATIGLYGLIGGDDEEAKRRRKNPLIKTGMTLLNRVSSDLSFFYSPQSISQLAGNTVPLLKLVKDLGTIPVLMTEGLFGDDITYKTGSRKGKNKLITKVEQVIPGIKEIDTFGRLANKESLEELR